MAKPFGGTVNNKEPNVNTPTDRVNVWQAANIVGMDSTRDPVDIDNQLGVYAGDCVSRFDGLERRNGTKWESITKPDSNKILATHYHKQNDGTINIWRFTKDSVNRKNSATFTPYVGVLTGTDSDRIKVVSCFDKIVFTNGVDKLQLIDIAGFTFADLSSLAATKFKYLTVFYNRIIGAYDIVNSAPTTIAWSAEYPDIDEFDSTVDVSAGRGPLIDSPNDESDFITQILGAEELLYVLRERSIWVGSKQPSASNPFYFRTAVASIGCDCSWSAALIPGGIIWADTKSGTIWKYQNGELERIGLKVEKEFLAAVTDISTVQGCYNQATQEYALLVPTLDSTQPRIFIWSGRTSEWTIWDYVYNVSTIQAHPYGTSSKTIDELIGTIDSLSGTIDSLGGISIINNPYVFGRNDGEISYTSADVGYDPNETIPGLKFDYPAILESKIFTRPVTDEFIAEVRVYYDCEGAGSITLYYRKNDAVLSADVNTWIPVKSVIVSPGWQRFIKFTKNIRCRNYQFKVMMNSNNGEGLGKFRLLRYEILTYPAGVSKR